MCRRRCRRRRRCRCRTAGRASERCIEAVESRISGRAYLWTRVPGGKEAYGNIGNIFSSHTWRSSVDSSDRFRVGAAVWHAMPRVCATVGIYDTIEAG